MSYQIKQQSSATIENLENRVFLSASPLLANAPQHSVGKHHTVVPPATVHKKSAPTTAPKQPTPAPAAPVVKDAALMVAPSGSQLLITGTTGNDAITVSQTGTTYTIKNGTWSTTVTGVFKKIVVNPNGGNDSIVMAKSVITDCLFKASVGNETITSGSGNDTIYADTGINVITLGTGNDTVIALGTAGDTITAGAATDIIWMDNRKAEVLTNPTVLKARNIHRVTNFMGFKTSTASVNVPKTGGSLLEPGVTDKTMSFKNFSTSPLFSDAGPSEDDISQGYTGDCFFLSVLSSVAKLNPSSIRNMVADLGDGTYAVQFTNPNGTQAFVRVDANLATWGGSAPAYANLGKGGSLWVAIVEKAFTEYRYSTGNATTGYNYASYGAIDGGWMDESYTALGCANTEIYGSNAADLANQIGAALAAGKAVAWAGGSTPAGTNLIADHAYTVDHVNRDSKGAIVSITLRNPWGVDGYNSLDGVNDGYVTVTVAQLSAASLGAVSANVA